MLRDTDLEITDIYGDYSYGRFDEDNSDFMIYRVTRKWFADFQTEVYSNQFYEHNKIHYIYKKIEHPGIM